MSRPDAQRQLPPDLPTLQRLAEKYIWWKPSSQAISQPERVAAQVMELGDWADVETLQEAQGDDYLRHVLSHAEPGQFSERSWHFWHYRLGLAALGDVPALPQRQFH